MGGIDVLVNNAGLTRDGLMMRMKDADWDNVLAVNLTATFRLARAALKPMLKRRYGRIISITSVVGVTGNSGQANYAASKAGMIGLSKSLAREVAARGVTVNCVAPGFIGSPMTDVLTDAQKSAILSTVPTGRLGDRGGNCRCRGLSGEFGSRVCDRRNAPRKRWNGNDLRLLCRFAAAKVRPSPIRMKYVTNRISAYGRSSHLSVGPEKSLGNLPQFSRNVIGR